MLVIKYIRTGVERYNSGSWNIMAGYEDEGFAKFVMQYEEAQNVKNGTQKAEGYHEAFDSSEIPFLGLLDVLGFDVVERHTELCEVV